MSTFDPKRKGQRHVWQSVISWTPGRPRGAARSGQGGWVGVDERYKITQTVRWRVTYLTLILRDISRY